RRNKQVEVPRICRTADSSAKSHGRVNVSFEMEIFRNDAGIPSSARCCNQSSSQVRKDAGKDKPSPSCHRAKFEYCGDFLQVTGDGNRARDHIEENVPLRSQQKENH